MALGVLKHAVGLSDLADLEVGKLPWTDRMFFEFVANLVDDLEAPWATCEFDSAFMTDSHAIVDCSWKERMAPGAAACAAVGVKASARLLAAAALYLEQRAFKRVEVARLRVVVLVQIGRAHV